MIPSDILTEIDALVHEGLFPDREAALRAVLQAGLDRLRHRGPARPGRPPPPLPQEPGTDEPIDVKPWDVNWAP
jgi:Arc/MetJ-type ribon-helix-helix transcriptional regulator